MNKKINILAISIISLVLILMGSIEVFAANCWVTRTWDCHDEYQCSDWECDNNDEGMFCTNWGKGPLFGNNATPPPPPPPPPVHGACNPAVSGQSFFGQPTGSPVGLCSAGNATGVSGDGSVANPWLWYCNGYDGGSNSAPCTATLLPTATISCDVDPLCQNSRNVKETVTWTASVSSGSGYTYVWTSNDVNDFVNGKTSRVVSGEYTTSVPRIKTARVAVTDNQSNTVNVSCPTACISGRGGGGGIGSGIEITNNGVCSPTINEKVISSHPNESSLCFNGAVSNFLKIVPENYWGDNKLSWTWTCLGADPIAGDINANCSTALNSVDGSNSLGCSVSMIPTALATVNINTNTTWRAASSSASKVVWEINDINGNSFPAGTSNTIDKIFTTIGLKNINAKIASSTEGIYGLPCVATTTVVQSGQIREQ